MGTEGPFDLACLHLQPLEGIADGGLGRCPTPLTAESAAQALSMGVDELVNAAIGGRPGGHRQDAEQQQVGQVVHPTLGAAVISNVSKAGFQ